MILRNLGNTNPGNTTWAKHLGQYKGRRSISIRGNENKSHPKQNPIVRILTAVGTKERPPIVRSIGIRPKRQPDHEDRMGEVLAIMMTDARKRAAEGRAIFVSINTVNAVRKRRLKSRPYEHTEPLGL